MVPSSGLAFYMTTKIVSAEQNMPSPAINNLIQLVYFFLVEKAVSALWLFTNET